MESLKKFKPYFRLMDEFQVEYAYAHSATAPAILKEVRSNVIENVASMDMRDAFSSTLNYYPAFCHPLIGRAKGSFSGQAKQINFSKLQFNPRAIASSVFGQSSDALLAAVEAMPLEVFDRFMRKSFSNSRFPPFCYLDSKIQTLGLSSRDQLQDSIEEFARALQEIQSKREAANLFSGDFAIKFIPYFGDGKVLFRFRSIYGQPLAQVSDLFLRKNQIYFTGSGNLAHDFHQAWKLRGKDYFNCIAPNSQLQVISSKGVAVNRKSEEFHLIPFGHQPLDLVSIPLFKKLYSYFKATSPSLHSWPGGQEPILERIEVGSILVRPKTWILSRQQILNHLRGPGESRLLGLPKTVNLNVFGALITLDMEDRIALAGVMECLEFLGKRMERFILEEREEDLGRNPLFSMFGAPVPSEIVFGLEHEE